MEKYKSIFNNLTESNILEFNAYYEFSRCIDLRTCYQPSMSQITQWCMMEAVISPEYYIKQIHTILKSLKNNIINKYKNLSLTDLCDILTKELQTYKIKFVATTKENKDKNYVTNGGIIISKLEIIILCYYKTIMIQNSGEEYNNFIKQVLLILGHELIHRNQILKVNNDKLRLFLFKGSPLDLKDRNKAMKYLANKHEIMSYAWQIIETFRLKGKKDTEIQSILQSNENKKFAFDPMLLWYHQIFSIVNNPLKRLYKYMYEYLNYEN